MNLLSITVFFISIVLGLVGPMHSKATELSTAANNLAAGEWAQLSNTPTNFWFQGSVGTTLSHMGEGTWDPISRRVYFLGSHARPQSPSKLHVYDDEKNLWQEGGRIPAFPRTLGHGYNHNAFDAGSGILGFLNLSPTRTRLYQFSIQQTISTTNTWELASTTSNTGNIAESLAYFPERGTWVVADGTFGDIREYNPDTNTWSVITRKSSCFGPNPGVYHTFAVYLPLRREVAFGGGNTSNSIHRRWCTVDDTGTVVQQPDAPATLSISARVGLGALITADPESGDLLVMSNTGQLHAFDFLTGHWGTVNDVGRPDIFNHTFNNVSQSVVIPISTYGVIMYAKRPEVWIYKHSPSVSTSPPPGPPAPPPGPPAPPPGPPAPPLGQTTSFTVAHSSKCLEISDSSQSHGGVAIQNTCDSGENQQFQLTPVGSNTFQLIAQHSDQCLEIAGASTSNGARVQQNACHNGSNQRFRVTNSPSTLVAVHSGKCIDVSLGTSSSSGTVHQWTCHGRPNQQWTWATGTSLPPEPPAPPSGQTTSFTVAHSSKCLEISDSSQSHGGVAIQNTCDSGENQQFQLTPVGSNTFQLIAQHSDQCLEIAGASTSNGARVQQNACHNGSNQRFRVTNSPSTLVAVHSGKCIDVSLGTSSSSGTIHQWTCHGRPNQQWTWAAGTSP